MDTKFTLAELDMMHFGQVLPKEYNRQPLFDFAALSEYHRQIALYVEILSIKDLLANRNNNSCDNAKDGCNGGNN